MTSAFGMSIPQTLEEVCDPRLHLWAGSCRRGNLEAIAVKAVGQQK
jgi:hypothetical protein